MYYGSPGAILNLLVSAFVVLGMKYLNKRLIIPGVLTGVVLVATLFAIFSDREVDNKQITVIEDGSFSVWSVYAGKVEARSAVTIMSKFDGMATIVDLVTAGKKISRGDLLVRLDSTKLERELLKLENEYALAKTDKESLVKARIPLDIRGKEVELLNVQGELDAESQYLKNNLKLAREDLISVDEVKQLQRKVDKLKSRFESLEIELDLTRKYLNPLAIEQANSKLSAAEQALVHTKRQLQNSVIRAPGDGVVVYKPLNISGEFRAVRIGDSVFANQIIMVLPDLSDLLIHIEVPESELSAVKEGNEVIVRPLAYRELALKGKVEHISSVAQSVSGRPTWQRYFHVTIGLNDADARLRPGMSVTAHILSYQRTQTTLVPRRAVVWVDGKPRVEVQRGFSFIQREIRVGLANNTHYEVIEGLESGDTVTIK